jgi:hypothetical protein
MQRMQKSPTQLQSPRRGSARVQVFIALTSTSTAPALSTNHLISGRLELILLALQLSETHRVAWHFQLDPGATAPRLY